MTEKLTKKKKPQQGLESAIYALLVEYKAVRYDHSYIVAETKLMKEVRALLKERSKK